MTIAIMAKTTDKKKDKMNFAVLFKAAEYLAISLSSLIHEPCR